MPGTSVSNTLDLIKPLLEMSYKVKALIYGPPGVGKTVMAACSPAPLLLDSDGTGALSLLNHPELAANTKVLSVKSYNQMLDVLEAFKAGTDPRVADRETIIIDTLSQLAKRHLDEVIDKERFLNPNRDPVPFQRDYKFNTEGMRRLVTYFLELDVNLICITHDEDDKDESTGIMMHKPFLTPKLLSTMEAVFDVFGYMTAETDGEFNTTRTLQISPSRRVWAKSRIGGMPPLIKDPTFQNFVDAKHIMLDKAHKLAEQLQQQNQSQQEIHPAVQADTALTSVAQGPFQLNQPYVPETASRDIVSEKENHGV